MRVRHSAIVNGTGLDHDGFIEREGNLARVPRAFAPVVEATKAAILRAFGPSRLHSLPRWRDQLGEARTDASLHVLSRGVGRRLVRTGFTLVMPRWGGWTSDLDESATVFGRYYPARRDQMQAAAAVARTPTADSSVLGMLINRARPGPSRARCPVHVPADRRPRRSRNPAGVPRSPRAGRRCGHRPDPGRRRQGGRGRGGPVRSCRAISAVRHRRRAARPGRSRTRAVRDHGQHGAPNGIAAVPNHGGSRVCHRTTR
jgi:hypothetical protein